MDVRALALRCGLFTILPALFAGSVFGAGFDVQRTYKSASARILSSDAGVIVTLPSHDVLKRPGHPQLPVEQMVIAAPEGMRLAKLNWEVQSWDRLPWSGKVDPAAPGRDKAAAPEDPDAYGSAVYPSQPVAHTSGGYMRGRRMEHISLMPVRYFPEQGFVEVASSLSVTPVFVEDREERLTPRPTPWETDNGFARTRALYSREMRPERQYRPAANGGEPFSPRFIPSEDGSPVRYLIITDDPMASSFQRLAEWKTALGIPAVVRTVSWIESTYPQGVDAAEDIRSFLQRAVQDWGVEYVLLGGDIDNVPIRYAKSLFAGGELIPTDLYYTCLDGNWNTDGDAFFGEGIFSQGDNVDLYPDVWVGRAPVRDSVEAARFVSKSMTYESAVPLGGSFSESMMTWAEMLTPQNWTQGDTVLFDGAQLAEVANGFVPVNMTNNRMYENYIPYGVNPLYIQDAINEFNSGYNLTLHVGHGFTNTMSMGIGGATIGNADADAFHNGSRQGVIYAINCTSSALDFDCIAEHLIRNPTGGAVGSVGSTRLDFPETGQGYQSEFFDLLLQQGVTRMGEASALQKFPYIGSSIYEGEHRWTQMTLIYFGDPSLDFYTGAVDQMSVSVVEPLLLGSSSFTVQVTDGGGPVASATVCLQKEGDAYAVGTTDGSGTVVLPFAPDTPGKASVGVRMHNRLCSVDSLDFTPDAAPHLFLSDLIVDDALGGDGDGNLEAGETALLTPVLSNLGGQTATGVSTSIVSVPPGITLLDGSAAFGDLAPGDTSAALDTWGVQVASWVLDETVPSLTVQYDAAGYTRQGPLLLYVGAPRLDLIRSEATDNIGNGNANGILEPNEDHFYTVTMINNGLGTSFSLMGTLSSSDPAVTIIDGVSNYGDLEPGAEGSGDGFQFQFSDALLTHTMTLTLTDHRGVSFQRTLELSPPGTPLNVAAEGTAESITLTWDQSFNSDIRGYRLYSSLTSGGPYNLVNDDLTDAIAYYEDADLPPLTRRYYVVAAVDSSGNEGNTSGEIEATTTLEPHMGAPFNVGASVASSPGLAFLNGDVLPEIVACGQEINVFGHDGEELIDGDGNVQTVGVFSNTGLGPFWSSPSVADIDDDGIPEIASGTWTTGHLFVWDDGGNVEPGWPINLNIDGGDASLWSAPALGDLDNDGDMEIVINCTQYVFAFHHDGTELFDGDGDAGTHGVFLVMGAPSNYSTPTLADVDNDGYREIIVGSRDGNLYVMNADGSSVPNFPHYLGGEITNSPAVGDLDNNGTKEMVVATSVFQVHALDKDLNSPPGWPVGANMNQDLDSSPALADMDGDGFLDVLINGGNGTPYIYRGHNGQLMPGWGFVLYTGGGQKVQISSSPSVGNLDADPELEVVFGAHDGNLYGYNLDATLVDGFPIGTGNIIDGGAILWDVDGDGLTEVIASSFDEKLYVWDSPGAFDPQNQPWPMFKQNTRRDGEIGDVWQVIGTPQVPAPPDWSMRLAQNPVIGSGVILFQAPDGFSEVVELSVYDVRGRKVREVFRGVPSPGLNEFRWDGLDASGREVSAGVYFSKLQGGGNSEAVKLVLVR